MPKITTILAFIFQKKKKTFYWVYNIVTSELLRPVFLEKHFCLNVWTGEAE